MTVKLTSRRLCDLSYTAQLGRTESGWKSGPSQLEVQSLYSAILYVSSLLKRIALVLGNTLIKAAYRVSRTDTPTVSWTHASKPVLRLWELGMVLPKSLSSPTHPFSEDGSRGADSLLSFQANKDHSWVWFLQHPEVGALGQFPCRRAVICLCFSFMGVFLQS